MSEPNAKGETIIGPMGTDAELLELAWGIIANAGSGDWKTQTPEWQEAAARWRDQWLASTAKTHAVESGDEPYLIRAYRHGPGYPTEGQRELLEAWDARSRESFVAREERDSALRLLQRMTEERDAARSYEDGLREIIAKLKAREANACESAEIRGRAAERAEGHVQQLEVMLGVCLGLCEFTVMAWDNDAGDMARGCVPLRKAVEAMRSGIRQIESQVCGKSSTSTEAANLPHSDVPAAQVTQNEDSQP